MDLQEAPKQTIELVKKSPRGRDPLQEIDGIIGVIERINNILEDYPDTIKEIKASIENNTKEVSTLATSFESYKQTADQKIDKIILSNATDIQGLDNKLLDLETFAEGIKSQLNKENTGQEEKIKALQELLAKNSSVSANSSAPNFEEHKKKIDTLETNNKKLEEHNEKLRSHVKLFGTISAINFVGLILAFSIWLNSHLGLR